MPPLTLEGRVMSITAWALTVVYAVGLVVTLVAACSTNRYRELQDEKKYEGRSYVTSGYERHKDYDARRDDFLGHVVFAFIWPITIVVWCLGKILVELINIMSIPGERKAERDGLINKEKK